VKFILAILFIVFLGVNGVQSQSRIKEGVPTENNTRIIRYYPNPATTQIFFEFTKGSPSGYTFQIYNLLGKKVTEIKNVNNRNQVNLTDFSRGVYLFQLLDRNGKVVESGKFQVSK
jgi:Secretion system C-terminal sorting domain